MTRVTRYKAIKSKKKGKGFGNGNSSVRLIREMEGEICGKINRMGYVVKIGRRCRYRGAGLKT